MLKDLVNVSSVSQKNILCDEKITKIVIKQVTYIDKRSISSPLLRLQAENCFSLDEYYPLSVIKSDARLNKETIKSLKNSEHTIELYKTHLFKIPDVFFGCKTSERMILVSLNHKESDEGYDTVVKISSKFKVAGYIL